MTRYPGSGRLCGVLVATLTLLGIVLGVAQPAAAVTRSERLTVLARWTQTSVASYNAWNQARVDRTRWAAYAFDWSTDGCSASPDQPLGFDFRRPCHRHDFGYRNYRALGLFSANKARVDSAFHADLTRRCDTYALAVRPACYSLAWTYYQAVKIFGYLAVAQSDIDRAARLKADGERAAARS